MSEHKKNQRQSQCTIIGNWKQIIHAKKDYVCYGCSQVIPKATGENDMRGVHFYAFTKDNGKTESVRVCARCMYLEMFKDDNHKGLGFRKNEFNPLTMASIHRIHEEELYLLWKEKGMNVLDIMAEKLYGKKNADLLTNNTQEAKS